MYSAASFMGVSSYSSAVSGGVGSGKVFVPVQPGMVMYSHFEHVSGVAAGAEQKGVAVSKVQILNRMIDHLVSMKQKPELTKEQVAGLSDQQKDSLIQEYQAKIEQAVAQTQSNPYALSGAPLPVNGDLVNIAA
ncbi:MAG: hypothetical protein MJ183_02390 [Treponemataceae bacterium]|nr:hypothetical protein [Treponemataceae bacterium]